jgi:hypothetical protein
MLRLSLVGNCTGRSLTLAPFNQILHLCEKAGLVKLGHVALDGTKIKANASKHNRTSVPPCSGQSRPSPSGGREDAASLDRPCARRLRDLAVGMEECSQRGSNQRIDPAPCRGRMFRERDCRDQRTRHPY